MAKNATVDTSKFEAGLRDLAARWERQAASLAGSVGDALVNEMRQTSPSRHATETLEATSGRDAKGPYSEVSVGPWWISFLEWGTSQHSARPFFRPALEHAPRLMAGKARQAFK